MSETSKFVIELTDAQHKELLTILTRYSTNRDHWAVSEGLRLAITEAEAHIPPCPRCGATQDEIDQAWYEAVFYLPCGCDDHGDHLGCTSECQQDGCTKKLYSVAETVCDHTKDVRRTKN